MPHRSALLLAALLACASAAVAEPAPAPCWAANVTEPVTSDNLPIGDARFAPLHRALDVLEALGRANPGLNALPEVRLRNRREINDAFRPSEQPYNATLHVHGFGPKAWGRGDCEVIPQADRLGARAGISFFINTPLVRLNRWLHDEQLTTYLEPERGEPMQGWPVYGGCAVLTADRRLWWQPVTVGEMLDLYAREQQRRIDEHVQRHRRDFEEPFDLAQAEARIAEMRRIGSTPEDRARAEAAADLALRVARERKAREPAYLHKLMEARAVLQTELDGLKAARAALGPAAAGEPYRLGSGRWRLPTEAEATRPLKRVVKLDPRYPWDGRQRMRVQAIHVCPSMLDRNPVYGPPMREAARSLDLQRVAALLN